MRKRKKAKKTFDWGKFWRKFAIRFAYRIMEMSILLAVGALLGFKLVRY